MGAVGTSVVGSRRALSANVSVDMRRGLDRRDACVREPADEVDRLAGTLERSPAQLGVVLAVAEHPRPALGRVGLVRGGAAVHLVERPLADDRADGDVGRRSEALVELEVGVAAAGASSKLSSKQPTCSSWARGTNMQLLSHTPSSQSRSPTKWPISKRRWPALGQLDGLEEPVLVLLVVAVVHRVALLARPDVPLLGRDDRRRVGGEAREPEAQHARRQHVGAVDHQRERAAAPGADAAVERRDRRRRRRRRPMSR